MKKINPLEWHYGNTTDDSWAYNAHHNIVEWKTNYRTMTYFNLNKNLFQCKQKD